MSEKSKKKHATGESLHALEALKAIMTVIACDRRLDDQEVNFLQQWLRHNKALAETYPGRIFIKKVDLILKDGSISNAERELLLQTIARVSCFEKDLRIPYRNMPTLMLALYYISTRSAEDQAKAYPLVEGKIDDPIACWIHALLEKIHDNHDNSRYLYRRVSQASFDDFIDPYAELARIMEYLGIDQSDLDEEKKQTEPNMPSAPQPVDDPKQQHESDGADPDSR